MCHTPSCLGGDCRSSVLRFRAVARTVRSLASLRGLGTCSPPRNETKALSPGRESKQFCHDCIPQSSVWTEVPFLERRRFDYRSLPGCAHCHKLPVHDRWPGVRRKPAMSPPAVDSDAVPALSHGGNRRVLNGWLRNAGSVTSWGGWPCLSDRVRGVMLQLRIGGRWNSTFALLTSSHSHGLSDQLVLGLA
jgi:hypothetical protein